MFYFTQRVVELKAWQLYLGNAFWTLFVGLLLLMIANVLGIIVLENDVVNNLLKKTGHITEARNPVVLTELANQVLRTPGHIMGNNHPSPTQAYYS